VIPLLNQIPNIGTMQFDRARPLQPHQGQQRPIAPTLDLVILGHGSEQVR